MSSLEGDLKACTEHIVAHMGWNQTEKLYARALEEELKDMGYTVERESPIRAMYTTIQGNRRFLGTLYADLIVRTIPTSPPQLIEVKFLNATETNMEDTVRQIERYVMFSSEQYAGLFAVFFQKTHPRPPVVHAMSAMNQ